MKLFNTFAWTFIAVMVAFTTVNMAQAAETKKACITTKDPKTGKDKEVCKEVKVHKKLDGTPVPEKK
jgi:predicted ATP-grasp superfamily ATP-dependent carboligase